MTSDTHQHARRGIDGLDAPLDQPTVQHAFERQHARDELGHCLHRWSAALSLYLISAPTSIVELAGLPVVTVAVCRLWSTWRLWIAVFRQPHVLALIAWAAWGALSITWSSDKRVDIDEIGQIRWVWLIPVIWPVIDRRPMLIVALVAGFLGGNVFQAINALGPTLGLLDPICPRAPGRHSGWWDPVVGGSVLVGALGLHLPAILSPRRRTQIIAVLMATITLVAIVATGSRGAWIAALATVILAGVLAAWSQRGSVRRVPRRVVIVALVILIASGAALGRSVSHRLQAAYDDLARAIESRDFNSDTGSRLLLNWWAIEAFAEHPVRGVGLGGFREWVTRHLEAQDIDPNSRIIHAHAHNAYLHAAATTGLVGLALGGMFVVLCLRNAWRWAAHAPTSYAAGPFLGMVGLLLVGLFDSIHVNAQTAALWMALAALCPAVAPVRKIETL